MWRSRAYKHSFIYRRVSRANLSSRFPKLASSPYKEKLFGLELTAVAVDITLWLVASLCRFLRLARARYNVAHTRLCKRKLFTLCHVYVLCFGKNIYPFSQQQRKLSLSLVSNQIFMDLVEILRGGLILLGLVLKGALLSVISF